MSTCQKYTSSTFVFLAVSTGTFSLLSFGRTFPLASDTFFLSEVKLHLHITTSEEKALAAMVSLHHLEFDCDFCENDLLFGEAGVCDFANETCICPDGFFGKGDIIVFLTSFNSCLVQMIGQPLAAVKLIKVFNTIST